MIKERYMISGNRIDNGAIESGFLVIERAGTSEEKYFIADKMTGYHTSIDPDTIEPVRANPIYEPRTGVPSSIYCPNCNYDLMGGVEENPEHGPPYCWECGQALDWSE